MDKEIIKNHVDAILEEISEPINHNFDTLEQLNDRVSSVENIIEDSSLEHGDIYDINDKIETLQNDFEDLDDKVFRCIEKVENVYKIDTQIDDDLVEVLNNIDNKLIKDLYFILNDKILDQGVTRLKQVSELGNNIKTLDAKIDNTNDAIKDKSWSVNKVAKLDAKIDNLSNIIDGLLNGKIRLVKPQNKLVEVMYKLCNKCYNMVRVGLAKVKGMNRSITPHHDSRKGSHYEISNRKDK